MAHALEPKDWSYRPPRKVRIGALKSAPDVADTIGFDSASSEAPSRSPASS